MVLAGKVSAEIGIKSPSAKFYSLFATQLHDVQNHAKSVVHETKLHEGEDWHHPNSVKQWTYVIDGEVHTCQERLLSKDDESKTINWNLFGGDISKHYKTYNFSLQVVDNNGGDGAIAKWTIEYEKLHEDIEPPLGQLKFLIKGSKEIDAKFSKA